MLYYQHVATLEVFYLCSKKSDRQKKKKKKPDPQNLKMRDLWVVFSLSGYKCHNDNAARLVEYELKWDQFWPLKRNYNVENY